MFDLIRRAWGLQNYELQNLLIERFQLQFHRETQETQAYVLLPAKGGPKLKVAGTPAGRLGFGRSPKGGEPVSGNVGLDLLARAITAVMGRPVINQTGLTGAYEILVDYEPDNSAPGDPNLQHAIEDTLGLRLEYRKVPISVFVVDHIAPAPREN